MPRVRSRPPACADGTARVVAGARRGDRRRLRIGRAGRRRPSGTRRHRHAAAGADQRRRLALEPRRHHARDFGERSRRTRRAQHQGINAVERAMPLLGRLFDLKREIDAHSGSVLLRRRPRRGRHELQYRPGRLPLHGRSPHRSRRGLRCRETVGSSKSSNRRGRQAPRSRSGRSRKDAPRRRPPTRRRPGAGGERCDVTGAAPEFEPCPGLLEIRFYAERGVPAFAYGPGLLAVSHGPQEFVESAAWWSAPRSMRSPPRASSAPAARDIPE